MALPATVAPNLHVVFTPCAPLVQSDRVLRIQGYSDLQRVRPAILKAAAEMAALAPELSKPKVAYRSLSVSGLCDGVLELDGSFQLHCKAFDRTLRGCTEVIVFVLTVGAQLDARVMELADTGDLLEALLLETTGWLCIEDATRQFKVHVREECMSRGSRITSRLGPGYSYKVDSELCSWNLEEQTTLFATFGGAELPVSLMSSCAMQPKMSRSGIIGVAPLSLAARGNSHFNADLHAVSSV
jgi:hypothetical protein